MAVAAGFLTAAILLAIVIIIRDKNGNKVAEMTVSADSTVTITNDAEKKEDAVAPKTTVDDAWIKQVAALPAEKQVEAVAAKLKELNPGFDGKVTPDIEDGVVTELSSLDEVTDISPLRALKKLTKGLLVPAAHMQGPSRRPVAVEGDADEELNFTVRRCTTCRP